MKKGRLTSRIRIQFLGLLMLLGVSVLGLKLWWIQVAHGVEWTAQLRTSSQATVRIPSVRGEIKDRNGLTLVQNRASYEVDFYLPEMVKGYRERFGSPPLTEYRATINGMPKDMKEPDIIKIVNDGIIPRLTILIWRATTIPTGCSDIIATTLKFRSLTSRTSISQLWRNFLNTMSGCLGWTSPSSRCALIF